MNSRLTAEEAAALAEIPLPSFRQRMSRLNDTEHDLRTTRHPGERARSYDAKKVAEWIADGMPAPKRPKNSPRPTAKDATEYTGKVSRKGRQLSAWFADLDLTVSARNATELEALAQQEISERFKISPALVRVVLRFDLPPKSQERLDQLTEAREQAKELQERITRLQQETAAELWAEDWSHTAIAEVLGVSGSRVYQILNGQ